MMSHSAIRVTSFALVAAIVLGTTGCKDTAKKEASGVSSIVHKQALATLAAVNSALQRYKADCGEYPPSGAENLEKHLTGKGMPGAAAGGGFRRVSGGRVYGPYISAEVGLRDPWGRLYQYRCPGQHNPDGFDLWSYGPDGRDGGGDDIGNWEWK